MARTPRLSPRFLAQRSTLGIAPGSPASRALGAVLGRACAAPVLPEPGDSTLLIDPEARGVSLLVHVRRVPGHNVVGDDGGARFGGGGAASGPGALAAHIEQNRMTVTIVTLSCAGPCADVVAVASGGRAPYTFAWDDGSTSAARHVCPAGDTTYSVKVTDTGTTGELSEAPETVEVPLTADVLACPDGGGSGGSCEPGSYVGAWNATGPVDAGAGAPTSSPYSPNPSGPLTLVLAASTAGGSNALVPTGEFAIDWAVAAQWLVHPAGSLDCTTGAFRAEDPVAAFTVGGLSAGTCDFAMTGRYDVATASLAGQWTSLCGTSDWGGTWTTTRTP